MNDALIWGASGGIGRALVNLLTENEWRVFAAARDESAIPTAAFRTYRFAATDRHAIEAIASDLAFESDGLALAVYAAGDIEADRLAGLEPEQWTAVLDANVTGAFLTTRFTSHLLADDAHIVFIGAYVDHLIFPKMGAYAAAKAALEPFAAILQKENRKQKITLVKPGAVDTPFWEKAPIRLPKDAKPPTAVAEAILAHVNANGRGTLEL